MIPDDKDTGGFLLFLAIFLTAVVGRMLKSSDKISPRQFFGEILISVALCFASWHIGLLQDWNYSQIVVYGVFGALGHIQVFKFAAQQFSKRGS